MPARTVDCLIVGAGIAGLHSALELRKKHPEWTIVIAEAYNYVGGRVVSFTPKDSRFSDITWENGAGRIHTSHTQVLSYINSYNLPTFPISPKSEWRDEKHPSKPIRDPWPALSTILTSALSHLSKEELAASTIQNLLVQLVGKERTAELLDHFPYRAEVEVMRADVAIESLRHELHSQHGFVVVGGGLRQLIQRMRSEFESTPHSTLLLRHRLTDILPTTPPTAVFSLEAKRPRIRAHRIILALHASALREIHPFSTWPLLRHVRMEPLTRIYAIFPSPAWFSSITKTVSNSKIRYFIPINPAKGVAMISYVEGRDTKGWDSKEKILDELRHLFPEYTIPEPLFFKTHPWTDGCSYWLPISPYVSEKELSTAAFHPFPKQLPTVFVCGESFSTQQAWIEGALQHASQLLATHSQSF
jgi:monoamine oxidase